MDTHRDSYLDPQDHAYDTTSVSYFHSRKSSAGDVITNPDLSATPSRIPLPPSFMSEDDSRDESRFSFELNGINSSTPQKTAWNGFPESPKLSESFSFFTEQPSMAHFNNSPGNHVVESLSNSASPSNTDSDLSKKLSRIKKTATHSRQSSISWNVDVPEEWTLNNITFWLNLYNFNESWLSMIKAHNLTGESFLSLANYPVLKTYTHEVDTINDSTPSRFIHLLRKTTGRKTSETLSLASTNFNELHASNVSAESFDSIVQSPVEESKETNFEPKCSSESSKSSIKQPAGPAKSAANIPKSSPLSTSSSSSSTLKHSVSQRTANTRHSVKNTVRPVSTIEYSSSRSNSPTSSFSYNVFRKHQKSNSSESNFFSKIHPNASSNDLELERKSSVKSKKGLLTKFKKIGEEISKSNKGRDRLPESPISPASTTSPIGTKDRWRKHQKSISIDLLNKDWKQAPRKSLEKNKIHIETPKERSKVSKSEQDFLDLYEKFKPAPLKDTNSKHPFKYVLVTRNDTTFVPVDVTEVKDVKQFKDEVLKALDLTKVVNISFHLTEFGHIHGIALDDDSLERVRTENFRNGPLKFYVKCDKLELVSSSTTSSMTLSFKSIEEGTLEKGSSRYPSTPQYLLDTIHAYSKDNSVDYLNIKDKVKESQETRNESIPLSTSTSAVPTNKERSFSFKSAKDEHLNNSFRVIRNKNWEVDFDKKRKSPYERTRQLVAKRNPPPPPSPNSPPKNSLQSKEKRDLPVLNSRSPSSNTSWSFGSNRSLDSIGKINEEPTRISPFTPGSSNTLIPKPYKGSSLHERRPVLPNERRGSRRRSSSLLTTSSIVSGNSYQNFNAKTDSLHDPSSGDLQDTFKEESSTFEELPTFDISNRIESCSEDEDDDFWAKPPSSNTNTITATVTDDSKGDQGDKIARMPSMAVRPPAEVVYDNLELFFPNTDLDKPLMDDASPPPSPNSPIPEVSPVNNTRPQIHRKISSVRSASDHLGRPNELGRGRVKTIRIVAQEAKKARARLAENVVSNKQAEGLLRRRSTKFWGRKVVEMKPGEARHLSKLKDGNGDYKQFAWVRGEMIGKGTYGKVFLALNVTTGEMMAVKQVDLPSNGQNSSVFKEVVDAILSEVDTLSELDHDNIVQYLGFEQRAQTYTLFLEYVAGGSVGWCLRVFGKFPEELIRFLTKQVLEGLAYIHSRGILHRDLKGDNLLLETDGTCKITDFGISKRSRNIYSNDAEMSMQGSIFWMAPEVIDNVVNDKKQGYSAKVDVWSLGCVVLEMFAGKRPWSNFEVISAMYNLGRSKSAPPISDEVKAYISPDGIDFINKCFTVDPDERPTAQSLLGHPFCETSPDFKFESTELAKLVKVNDKQTKVVFE